ncbi:MAG: DAK2 domain-containing protein [Christensenellaceae bacterium]|jgi:DAK2 domain fusion protein YloV|nr:DAK2 domain-containing protein [Christensenellaceae bacterium]
MITNIDVFEIKKLLRGGAVNINIYREHIDSLNVFPVPDGDTGTNMNLTMISTIREMDATDSSDIKEVCRAFSRGALKGARGNSGVILSQIFKGIADVLSESKQINTKIFANALKNGSNKAYDAVTNPKEGTILTVIRLVSEYATKISSKKADFLDFFQLLLSRGTEILDDTPNMLPVLKKAGVVDSGGKGLLVILTGMYNALAGIEMNEDIETATEKQGTLKPQDAEIYFPDIHNLEDIQFAYCTEFFIINLKKSATTSDIDKLRDKLTQIGDCVLVVGDLALVKVHVHTNNPDKALGYALQLGELDKPKIENMLEQGRAFSRESEKHRKKPAGIVAVCVGDGLKDIFTKLNTDVILEGGQTMNPSVSDIVAAVDSVLAETVYILPNNSNIILAAEQAKELTVSELVVIATKTVPQGIAAAINFNGDADVSENITNMQLAAESVRSGQVTYAVRNTESDGFDVKCGDILGIYDKIVATGTNVDDVTVEVISKMTDATTAAITLYYGDTITVDVATSLCDRLSDLYPMYDVIAYYGGQTHYYYFIAVE